MDFLQVIEKRKSVRKYSYRPVERELLDAIVKVAQTAPSSRNSKSSAFMIVEDKDTLVALSQMRDYGSALISGAPAAIVVLGDETKTDLWVDNCAISATFVQLAVTAMDLVSCWVHCNGRPRYKDEPEGVKAEDYVRDLLGIKDGLRPYCVVAIGYPQEEDSAEK
jgi:nitroreductase